MSRPGNLVAWLAGSLAILTLLSMGATSAGATAKAGSLAGSQGIDTALPPTDSQTTVHGRDAFANLAITVNQTAKLTNQAVSITWTGGDPTQSGPGRFGRNYLQIMQCWGDDDGTNPTNPGPPPEQCEQGATTGMYGGGGSGGGNGYSTTRIISRTEWANFDPNVGVVDPVTNNVFLPFRAVDGTHVDVPIDFNFNPSIQGGNYWLNPYYNVITTNEISAAATGENGTGAELFQVVTGVQSSGLGCGQSVQPIAGGKYKVPKCWIVVVPRSTPTVENAGTPFETAADQQGVVTSPMASAAWQHRIAIPIAFNPVDSPCALGADLRNISGSEIAYPAVASWQPTLCSTAGLPPYAYAPISDSAARQQLLSKSPGAPGMVVVSQPIDRSLVDPTNPVVYAPLSLSGLTIGFNVERFPKTSAPTDEQKLSGIRVAQMNLTPRLVAKLLTQSYQQQVYVSQSDPGYAWAKTNPSHMGLDPDFIKFNPEFDMLLSGDGRNFSGLQLPATNSDAAQKVWEWILADPEAKAWMNGTPDPWGMKVNPMYSISATLNPTRVPFNSPIPNSFPKADPYCYQAPNVGPGESVVPPLLCGTDWMPYRGSLAEAAQVTRSAAAAAKIIENTLAVAPSDVWTREGPQSLGRRGMLALTDTPSAAQFGLQMARLSRAGDDGTNRQFVAPDSAGLAAAFRAMKPGAEPTVLEPNPASKIAGAYPLPMLTYAAIAPLQLDRTARSQYAAFLDYAAGPGQVAGLDLGQLPRGYDPLAATLRAQTKKAATTVRTLKPAPPPPTTSTTSPTTTAAPTTTQAVVTTLPPYYPPPVTTPPTAAPTTVPSATTSTVPATTTIASTTTVSGSTTTTTTEPATVVTTPSSPTASGRLAVPGLGVAALGSALGALEITKRPRRRTRSAAKGGAS